MTVARGKAESKVVFASTKRRDEFSYTVKSDPKSRFNVNALFLGIKVEWFVADEPAFLEGRESARGQGIVKQIGHPVRVSAVTKWRDCATLLAPSQYSLLGLSGHDPESLLGPLSQPFFMSTCTSSPAY